MSDNINHPKHYTSHPSGVECITVTEWFNFNVGNAIKYLWRSGLKGSTLDDLKKARWYIDREIQRLEPKPEPLQADPHQRSGPRAGYSGKAGGRSRRGDAGGRSFAGRAVR